MGFLFDYNSDILSPFHFLHPNPPTYFFLLSFKSSASFTFVYFFKCWLLSLPWGIGWEVQEGWTGSPSCQSEHFPRSSPTAVPLGEIEMGQQLACMTSSRAQSCVSREIYGGWWTITSQARLKATKNSPQNKRHIKETRGNVLNPNLKYLNAWTQPLSSSMKWASCSWFCC